MRTLGHLRAEEELRKAGSARLSSSSPDRFYERRLLGALIALCGVLIAAGLAMPSLMGAKFSPSAITLGDISEAHVVEIRDRHGATVVTGEFRSRVDVLGNTEKDAALIDLRGRTVIGEVELEIPAQARKNRRAELEV